MKTVLVAIALLMLARIALAEQAVTAGQLLANGFEVRAGYAIEKGAPVLVLQKGPDAFLCTLIQGNALLRFDLAPVGKAIGAMPPLPTVCAPIK